MFTLLRLIGAMGLLLALVPGGAIPTTSQSQLISPGAAASALDPAHVATALHNVPVAFIQNIGQFADGARFQVRGGDHTVWLAEDALWVTIVESPRSSTQKREAYPPLERQEREPRRGLALKLSFPGANPHPRLEPFNRLDTHVSHFIGNDPGKWRTGVPVWGGVRYKDLYPGVDLEMTGENGRWPWGMMARPDANLDAVRLRVEGAVALAIQSGSLSLSSSLGDFTLPLLTVEGAIPNAQPSVSDVEAGTFEVAYPFTSAPSLFESSTQTAAASDLDYATFLGGSYWDKGYAIAVDGSANAYVTGYTASTDFPTTPGAFDTSPDSGDAFVVKVNGAGTGLVYATVLGGGDYERGYSIAVDGSGNAYVTGLTYSSDFPTTPGAFDTSYDVGDRADAFVTKLNSLGTSLSYSSFLGGWHGDGDYAYGIAVDESGNVYVTGGTYSSSFPTTPSAFDTSHNGGPDAWVAKLNPAGSDLLYATFLGGNDSDWGNTVALDGSGNAYVTGETASSDFPTTASAYDTSYNGGTAAGDAFVVKLNSSGSALLYGTFLGGGDYEWGYGIAVDESGNAYVTGMTGSSDFPATVGAFDTTHNGASDAFVVKMNPAGSDLLYATFLGGGGGEVGCSIAVDRSGNAYVTGRTYSSDFPTTPGAFDTSYNGGYNDAFVTKLNPAGTGLVYGTFLGGTYSDEGSEVGLDSSGAAYITGTTNSLDFPTTVGAFDTSHGGGICGAIGACPDVFVAKLVTFKTPVIIVPGIAASWHWRVLFDDPLPGFDWQWTPFVGRKSWSQFIDTLEVAGYEEGRDYFVAFYDWRRDNNWQNEDGKVPRQYLMETIDEARQAFEQRYPYLPASAFKVNIVAHSLGGIVTRSYVESPDYRGDVEQVVLLGSPHNGAIDAYYVWEGGEITPRWAPASRFGIRLYLYYMRIRHREPSPYKVIHDHAKVMRNLLPVGYDYLLNLDWTPIDWEPMAEVNDFLAYVAPSDDAAAVFASKGVGLATITGTNLDTWEKLFVNTEHDKPYPLWLDGEPVATLSGDGDGTVLTSSALISGAEQVPLPSVRHGSLPNEATNRILQILGIGETVTLKSGVTSEPTDEEILAIFAGLTVDVELRDEVGNLVGSYTTDPSGDFKIIAASDLAPGSYQLKILGEEAGDYYVSVEFYGLDVTAQEEIEGQSTVGEEETDTLYYNPDAPDPLQLGPFEIYLPLILKNYVVP